MALRRPRLTVSLLVIAALVIVVAGAIYFTRQSPPECARLLPESQAMVYFNLRPLRAATHFDRHPVPHAPDYQHFLDATGINFERDLDEAAFALHRTADPLGPNGPVAYSEVFVGHFDHARLERYLEGVAGSREVYAGRTVYSIPSAGRTVRVALLSSGSSGGMVAVSNTPTSEQMHSILDRNRTSLLPFSGSTLLAAHYRDVPFLSLAWGLGEIGLPFSEQGEFRVMGLTLPWRVDAIFIASLRWTGALRLRIEQIAPGETAASASATSLQALVKMGQFAENNLPGDLANENARALLNSATVVHYKDRAVLTATLPTHLFEKMIAAPDLAGPQVDGKTH